MKEIFIIGSKGIPANYGGFETFVENLTSKRVSEDIKYHVACIGNEDKEYYYNGARCFSIKIPNLGSAKAVYYDLIALKRSIRYIEINKINNAIIYVLACRIGPFISLYKRQLERLGIKLFVNPDGHEWKRDKWNGLIKRYWKLSERLMVKYSDLLICDSINIEKYIKEDYKMYNPKTTYIAYGAEYVKNNEDDDEKFYKWCKEKKVQSGSYYLVVGRFVPENNYELMIKEFMKTKINKDFVIITNIEKNKFYNKLKDKTNFENDKRIKFVGTVYDDRLLKLIRENAYGYLHGHEVGGTNPSLLEALATTKLNLLLDVGFNKEVGRDGALYFNKEENNLSVLIDELEKIKLCKIEELSRKAKQRINENYTWNYIVRLYEELFLKEE